MTIKQRFRWSWLVATSLWLALAARVTAAPAAPLDLKNFPAQFFPGLNKQTPERIYLEGLIRLYPGRVLDHAPEKEHTTVSRTALAESLPRGIQYVRIYDMAGAITALDAYSQSPALIIDLRYLYADPQSALTFLGYFRQSADMQIDDNGTNQADFEPVMPKEGAVRTVKAPIIVLVNERTRGYIEPGLQGLQSLGAIMTVGTRTAGATGQYAPAPDLDGFWIIHGEYRLQTPKAPSLLGVGLEPEITVDVSPEEDFTGYQLLESGYSAQSILQVELPTLFPNAITPADAETEQPVDPILQRAVQIVVALDLLGKLPTR